MIRMVDLIQKKRDGGTFSQQEIEAFIEAYTLGNIPDYQMSALLMAIYYEGMTDEETAALTLAMARSGACLDLSSIHGIKVDKHSTGGVGDTTTLVLAPLVASIGVPVAKMSGRGLGHTGGTIDKLEAIPGFQTEMTEQAFIQQVNDIGVAVMGQSQNLAPADKKLYALRDVTATVDVLSLIASSIMSKKIAAGADAIVLDVTVGTGAFMKQEEDALALARLMVDIGKQANRQTMAVISDMSQPLGNAIGNALEVIEAIDALQGRGPQDLMEMVYALGAQMAMLAGVSETFEEAKATLMQAIDSGAAWDKFIAMVQAQHGDINALLHPDQLLTAPVVKHVYATKTGWVHALEAITFGQLAMELGAGRATKEDVIDPGVGLYLHKKVGDPVTKGDQLCTIYAASEADAEQIYERILAQFVICDTQTVAPELIKHIIVD